MIEPPNAGEPVAELWKKVRALTALVNALSQITVTGAVKGKLVISGESAVIVIEQNQNSLNLT
jgi:hypothetical protein